MTSYQYLWLPDLLSCSCCHLSLSVWFDRLLHCYIFWISNWLMWEGRSRSKSLTIPTITANLVYHTRLPQRSWLFFMDFALDYLVWHLPLTGLYFAVWSALLHHFCVQDLAPDLPQRRHAFWHRPPKNMLAYHLIATSDFIPAFVAAWFTIFVLAVTLAFRYDSITYYTAISGLWTAFENPSKGL